MRGLFLCVAGLGALAFQRDACFDLVFAEAQAFHDMGGELKAALHGFGDHVIDAEMAQVIGMFVSEPARGSGAGRALMAAALDAAQARPGVKLVTLTVTEGNALAVALYEACGFQTFGIEPMAIWTGSDYRAKVHMWLALD